MGNEEELEEGVYSVPSIRILMEDSLVELAVLHPSYGNLAQETY